MKHLANTLEANISFTDKTGSLPRILQRIGSPAVAATPPGGLNATTPTW